MSGANRAKKKVKQTSNLTRSWPRQHNQARHALTLDALNAAPDYGEDRSREYILAAFDPGHHYHGQRAEKYTLQNEICPWASQGYQIKINQQQQREKIQEEKI